LAEVNIDDGQVGPFVPETLHRLALSGSDPDHLMPSFPQLCPESESGYILVFDNENSHRSVLQ
jgi:hypothetical protein